MLGTWSEQGPGSVSAAPTSALPKSCCRSCWVWEVLVVGSQCQPGSTQIPQGQLWSYTELWKSCENYVYSRVCQLGTVWDLQRNLESWNIITASLKLEKTSRTTESDLQNHWVQLLKLQRTFTGDSQASHRELPQTFQAFSTTAKAGIFPQWALTQHHKHTHTWDFSCLCKKWEAFAPLALSCSTMEVVMGHEKGGWEHRGRNEDKGRQLKVPVH